MPKRAWLRALTAFSFVLIVGGLWRAGETLGPTASVPGALVGVALFAVALGVCMATLGWYFYQRAEQLITRRIHRAILDFRRRLGIEQAKHDESRRHLMTGYIHWFDHQDPDAAIAHFERAVRAFPHGLGGYVALGYAYYNRGETEKAFNLFHRALLLYPDRKEPYRDLAGLLIREGELERALEYIEKAVKVDPTVRRDLLEDPLFDALKHEERTRDRYERALAG